MASFKDCCDNGCQVGNDGFCGFRTGRPFSFYQDQCQDVPPAGFRNIRSFMNPSGSVRGTVYTSLNGDIVGKFSGKIDGFPGFLGCMGNFGNFGLSSPFSFQFGNRTI